LASRKLNWRAWHIIQLKAQDLGEIVQVNSTDIVYVAGAGWIPRRRHKTLRKLAATGVRLVWMCFDLVPVSFKPTIAKQNAAGSRFQTWLDAAIRDKGKFICISDHVRDSLAEHAKGIGETVNAVAVPLAHEFRYPDIAPSNKVQALTKQDYALYVSSLGLRKNHLALLKSWQRLAAIHGADMPILVLAGSRWQESDIFPFLEQTQWLGGKVTHLAGLSDSDIAALYRHCRFTVYPSLSEGWGLPVGESLWMGKPCVCADNTSLPEVGGKWVSYFKADDPASMDTALNRALRGDFDGLPPDRAHLRTWDMAASQIAREVITP
jgi:glycosyltransferase involved in cell wall biosynthesis